MDRAQRPGQRRQTGPRIGGAAFVLAGAAAWGSTGTAAHFAPDGTPSASIGAARIVVGGVLLLVLAVRTADLRGAVRGLLTLGLAARAALVAAIAALAGYQACFFTAVRLTGVAVGTVVAIGSAPVFTGVVSRLAGGALPGRRWQLATMAAVAGCAVLVSGGRSAGADPAGLALALLAGLCYAWYAVVAARLIAAGRGEAAVMGVLFGGAAMLLTPVLAATGSAWLLSGRGVAVIAYLGVVTTVVAYLLYGHGLRTVPAPTAVTLGLAEPAVAALLGLVVLHERLPWLGYAGLALIGLALVALAQGMR